MEQRYQKVLDRFEAVQAEMAAEGLDPERFASLSREFADLSAVVEAIRKQDAMETERRALLDMVEGAPGEDPEMVALARDELSEIEARLPDIRRDVQLRLLPKDEADDRGVILEVRAGTGGDEAALFAGDLFRMYQRYSEAHGWRVEVLDARDSDLGGYREIVARLSGQGVFARLKFESGVHRVQRVPETEAGGRIHTSAATVAVLPEAGEVDVKIDDKDLRIDTFRSSGAGGQHVNTTDSAVRITHVPTGLVVSQQDEKSQHKNKAKAMEILRARLYDMERQRRDAERAADRKGQVGSGDRSERIRTYNFPQGRVSDHRINLTLYKLDKVIGGEALDEVIEPLIAEEEAARLAADGFEAV